MIWMIGIGGALGAATRYVLGTWVSKKSQKLAPFPVGTWIINCTGSFFLGLLAQLYLTNQIGEWLWFFGGIGFCGAYTTFSTFGNETIALIQSKKIKLAIIYVVTSIMAGVIAATIGLTINF